jgi:hypothetical protein
MCVELCKKKKTLPNTGIPIRKMSASYRGASSAYTEFGPPEIMIAL